MPRRYSPTARKLTTGVPMARRKPSRCSIIASRLKIPSIIMPNGVSTSSAVLARQKAGQDEGRVHVRGGGTHAQPADGLADRRVGRDTGTPDRVPRAQEAQNEPGEREQDRASHGTPGEPAGARRNR